ESARSLRLRDSRRKGATGRAQRPVLRTAAQLRQRQRLDVDAPEGGGRRCQDVNDGGADDRRMGDGDGVPALAAARLEPGADPRPGAGRRPADTQRFRRGAAPPGDPRARRPPPLAPPPAARQAAVRPSAHSRNRAAPARPSRRARALPPSAAPATPDSSRRAPPAAPPAVPPPPAPPSAPRP